MQLRIDFNGVHFLEVLEQLLGTVAEQRSGLDRDCIVAEWNLRLNERRIKVSH